MKKTHELQNGDESPLIGYELTASEFGTIEKLCPKYGFIKCQSKDNPEKRLFFHYTATKNPFEELQVGDNVSFQRGVSNGGKPLATDIRFQSHVDVIEGVIAKMPKKQERGSISYKYNEECFYLPFGKEDLVEDTGKVKARDEVLFEKALDERDGVAVARNVRKKYSRPLKVRGIVTSVKDKFGFIDRSDQVKEIYFNLSASPEGVLMRPGLELEFNVKHLRNGKEEAVNLRVLEPGSVLFLDLLDTVVHGTLLRSPDCKRAPPGGGGSGGGGVDLLAGNISYVWSNESKVMQIPFGEKDKRYPYTLHPGDIVQFRIGIDRRDQLQRACEVELVLESFPSRKETRHLGVVKMFDGTAGLIEPDLVGEEAEAKLNEDWLVAFKLKEWLVSDVALGKFSVVSYTPLAVTRTVNGVPKLSVTALRIMPCSEEDAEKMTRLRLYRAGSLRGVIKSPAEHAEDLGIIIWEKGSGAAKRIVMFTADDVVKGKPKIGDEVTFGCLDHIANEYLPASAFNIEVVSSSVVTSYANNSSFNKHAADSHRSSESRKHRSRTLDDKTTPLTEHILQPVSKNLSGWIVILKEYFGFIETSDHNSLYKFGPNIIKKSKLQTELKVGSAVEFTPVPNVGIRPRRFVDIFLKVVTEPLTKETVMETKLIGVIVRPLLISENTDKENQYTGLLEDIKNDRQFLYSMKSLVSFRTKLSPGDRVSFDVMQTDTDISKYLATNVILLRQSGRVSLITKSVVTVERISNEDEGDIGLPATFEIELNRTDTGGDVKSLSVDDIIQLDLNIDPNSKNLIVSTFKLLKSSENSISRKVYKATCDEFAPRILHYRGPRLPEGESIGFSEQLRRLPLLHC